MADSQVSFPLFPTQPFNSDRQNRFKGAFPDPYLDYASTQMPRSLYDVFRWCFLPGSLVRLSDGTLRPIEEVEPGDTVINRFGKPGRVLRTSERPWDGPIVKAYTGDGSAVPLCSIPEHNHFAVRPPRLKPHRCVTSLRPDLTEKVQAGDLRVGDYFVSPVKKLGETGTFPKHDPYVYGYYLGDGWPMQRYASVGPRGDRAWYDTGGHYAIRLIVSNKHVQVRQRLSNSLGGKMIETCTSGASAVCAVHDQELTDVLLETCGHGAHDKRLSEAVYTWSRDSVLHFLAGYFDADGHAVTTKDGYLRSGGITSCNKALLLQVRRLANSVGMTPTLSDRVLGGGGLVEEERPGYLLSFNWHDIKVLQPYSEKMRGLGLAPNKKGRPMSTVVKGDYIYRRIRRIEEDEYRGPVYNLEVEGEHSYLVNECATSNCEYVWITYGTYRMAAQRVVRYFLTSVELMDASDDEKEKYEEFIQKQLHLMEELAKIGDSFMAYGNAFISLRVPFRRYLRCPKCGLERPIEEMTYTWAGWEFTSRCPVEKCRHEGKFERIDRTSDEQDKLKIKLWSPHEIRIMYHPVSDDFVYFWNIPAWFKTEVKKGTRFYLEQTPWEVIEAVKKDQMLRFNDDVLYHMKEDTIPGVRTHGWGIPRIMGNFKQAWYVQVLRRFNEAIALDYIIPFRVMTPKPGTSREADPILHQNLPRFQSAVMNMWKTHRRDPTTIHALPFPIDLQMLGAEGRQLAPSELLEKGEDDLLNAQGVPGDFYRGNLQVQAAPTALRLFERTWTHLVSGYNGFLEWMFNKVSDLKNWENLSGRMQPVTLADDIEKKQIQLQLAAGQQISRQTAWAPFNINFREELKRLFEEEEFAQEQMGKFQERAAQKQELQQTMAQGAAGQMMPTQPGAGMAPGGMAPGGMPMQPGAAPMGAPAGAPAAGGMPMAAGAAPQAAAQVTPEDLTMQAENIAMQMLSMPYEMRRSQLLQIKKSNETLHALVISKMQQIRQRAQTEGGFAALQQAVGAGAMM